jgi:VanZ family protein
MKNNVRYAVAFYRYWVPVLVWMGVIFLLSSQPNFGTKDQALSSIQFFFRKGAHVVEYFILALLAFRLFRFYFPKNSHAVSAGVVLLSLLYALSDEAHQLFVSGRQGRISDIGLDLVGIFCAPLFSLVLSPWRRRRMEMREK